MADHLEDFWRMTDLRNDPLSEGAINLFLLLWRYTKRRDVEAHEKGGPPPTMYFTKEWILERIHKGDKTLGRRIGELQDSHWMTVVDQRYTRFTCIWTVGLWLPERRREALKSLGASIPDPEGSAGSDLTEPDNSVHDPPGQDCPRSPTVLSDDPPESSEIDPNSVAPELVNSLKIVLKLSPSSEESLLKIARERATQISLVDLAKEIVRWAIVPDGVALAIPCTDDGVRPLVTLLRSGEDLDKTLADVIGVLADAPEIVERAARNERGLQAADYYDREMFCGAVWTRWQRARLNLAKIRRLEAEAQARAPAAAADAEAAERRELATALRERLADAARYAQGELSPFERDQLAREHGGGILTAAIAEASRLAKRVGEARTLDSFSLAELRGLLAQEGRAP